MLLVSRSGSPGEQRQPECEMSRFRCLGSGCVRQILEHVFAGTPTRCSCVIVAAVVCGGSCAKRVVFAFIPAVKGKFETLLPSAVWR